MTGFVSFLSPVLQLTRTGPDLCTRTENLYLASNHCNHDSGLVTTDFFDFPLGQRGGYRALTSLSVE